jgi:hypothetical protein
MSATSKVSWVDSVEGVSPHVAGLYADSFAAEVSAITYLAHSGVVRYTTAYNEEPRRFELEALPCLAVSSEGEEG